jgi:hypothetical protein
MSIPRSLKAAAAPCKTRELAKTPMANRFVDPTG